MKGAVLWDSSALLALLDAADANHPAAVEAARQLASERRPSFITNYLEVEAHALLLRKLGRVAAREWLLRGGLTVVRATSAEEERAKEIIARHGDKDWSLCDAISFAVAEGRRAAGVFAFDRHFQQFARIRVYGLPPA